MCFLSLRKRISLVWKWILRKKPLWGSSIIFFSYFFLNIFFFLSFFLSYLIFYFFVFIAFLHFNYEKSTSRNEKKFRNTNNKCFRLVLTLILLNILEYYSSVSFMFLRKTFLLKNSFGIFVRRRYSQNVGDQKEMGRS